jgi:hypothetical protein
MEGCISSYEFLYKNYPGFTQWVDLFVNSTWYRDYSDLDKIDLKIDDAQTLSIEFEKFLNWCYIIKTKKL